MKTIQCGLLPGESRPVVERINEPLRAYLQRCLGQPVELVVGDSYVATGEALRCGRLDLAYLGPVTYILQSRSAGLEPFARPTHGGSVGPTFQAAIIVPADSPVEHLAQLRGGEIAMGDLVSTSGAWVPRHMLLAAGLSPAGDYVRRHLHGHDAVAAAVVERKVAAGALSLTIYRRLLAEGSLDGERVRILAESPPIPEYMWTFREGLPNALREDLRRAFIDLRDRAALQAFRAEAFIPAVDADVDRVRYWMDNILQTRLQSSSLPSACFSAAAGVQQQSLPLAGMRRKTSESATGKLSTAQAAVPGSAA